MTETTVWGAYLAAWRSRPWLAMIALAAVVLVVVSLAQTLMRGPLAFLFIPGLALGYVHHLMVRRTDGAQ